MKLPRLYKTSKTGSVQIIDIEIVGPTYTRTWGKLGGKMQSKSITAKAKNIGKTNETTAEEQAILEAKAIWAKKQKANYSTSQLAPITVKLPMKVNTYQKHKNKVIFPCYTSPKLNGVNCEYRLINGTLKLLSRGGEEYPIPAHQYDDIINILNNLGTSSLNGEMYIHGQHLQDIMAATKKSNELSLKLSFNVFDAPEIPGNYEARITILSTMPETEYIKFIPIDKAYAHEQLKQQHDDWVAKGYEGLVIRNAKGLYEYNTRSLDSFKLKETKDAEFEVCSFDIDKNGHVVFSCYKNNIHVGNNCTFKVKLKGTNEERLAMAVHAKDYIGKFLNVEYEMLSKVNPDGSGGIPLKPVGTYFRKVDSNGEAIE